MPRRPTIALAAILLASACSGGGSSGTIQVSAAASLTDAFTEIAAAFEQAHPGTRVALEFAGSATLRDQIVEGSPADVFASADAATMDAVERAGMVAGTPETFATNRLQIAVPAGNPAGITGLADFARPELLIGLCAKGVPCGDLARVALAAAGVVPSIDTDEPNVRALLTKIAAGELDAGLVYVTDVLGAGGSVEGIDLPPAADPATGYEVAVLAAAVNPDLAGGFVAFLRSGEGIAILERYGFGRP
jgi:molybdate transport system substrate-binding protein